MSESGTHTLSQMFNSAHSGASFLRICAFLKPADGNKLFPCVSLANVLYALLCSLCVAGHFFGIDWGQKMTMAVYLLKMVSH